MSKLINKELSNLGYRHVNRTSTGANELFIKVLQDNFFLCLGIINSTIYHSRFTASYYLSKSTRWSSVWGDIPKESYKRIGDFLTKEERLLFLDDEFNEKGVIDAWWKNDQAGTKYFIDVLKITESRFLEQKDLFKKVDNSKSVNEFIHYAIAAYNLMKFPIDNTFEYKYVPVKPINEIPIDLFKIAEKALFLKNGILNKNTVKALAADIWRQMQLNAFHFFLQKKS